MSNRFGDTATFFYRPGDTFSGTVGGTYLYLTVDEMFQYPVESFSENDKTVHVSKTGRRWMYTNYSLNGYTFNWTNAAQSTRDKVRRMFDANAVITFNTNGTLWGTFRIPDEEWQDSEVGYDLFDFNISIIEST